MLKGENPYFLNSYAGPAAGEKPIYAVADLNAN
jgi:hypothetical protein